MRSNLYSSKFSITQHSLLTSFPNLQSKTQAPILATHQNAMSTCRYPIIPLAYRTHLQDPRSLASNLANFGDGGSEARAISRQRDPNSLGKKSQLQSVARRLLTRIWREAEVARKKRTSVDALRITLDFCSQFPNIHMLKIKFWDSIQ